VNGYGNMANYSVCFEFITFAECGGKLRRCKFSLITAAKKTAREGILIHPQVCN
jgi:hypothetical protein